MGLLYDIGSQVANVGVNQLTAAQQFGRTKKLMGLQQQNQMELNEQGQALQMKTWQETNYPAQVAMLKQAGLNPGLLYSKGGAGGTTGGQTGGSAAMGQAQEAKGMDIQNLLAYSQAQANIKATEADAKLKETQAKKIGGVDTELTGVQIKETEGKIALMLSEQALNRASEALKGKELEVADTVKKLNGALTSLHEQQVQESIAKTAIDNKTLEWMKETGINPNDGQIAKTIKYLANETGIAEDTMIYILGGAIGVKELLKLIPQFLVKKLPETILKSPAVKGFGK